MRILDRTPILFQKCVTGRVIVSSKKNRGKKKKEEKGGGGGEVLMGESLGCYSWAKGIVKHLVFI